MQPARTGSSPAAVERAISDNLIGNTTIGVVATDAMLTKEEVNKVAQMAQDGLALAIRPCHTMADGDTVFALATGKADRPAGSRADVSAIGAAAAEVVAAAIVRAVSQAETLFGVPGLKSLG